MTLKLGTWVTHLDEDPTYPEIVGKVVKPTDEEVGSGASYEYPCGLEHGHVVVEWDDDLLSRAWEEVADLQIIGPPAAGRDRGSAP